MDAATLQSEITRLAADARSRREEANRLRMSATGNRALGNDMQADADERQAAKLERDADASDQQAKSNEASLADTLRQIQEIDRRQADLKDSYEREMADLQRQKERLSGGTGAFSSSIL